MQVGIIIVYVNLLKNLISTFFSILSNWSVFEKSLSIKTGHCVKKGMLSQYIRTWYGQALLYFVRIQRFFILGCVNLTGIINFFFLRIQICFVLILETLKTLCLDILVLRNVSSFSFWVFNYVSQYGFYNILHVPIRVNYNLNIENVNCRYFSMERMINKKLSDYFKLKVNAWKKEIKSLDVKIFNWLRRKQSISSFIIKSFIISVRNLISSYNLLISEILYIRHKFIYIKKKYVIEMRVKQKNIPHLINKLQCFLLESATITLFSILDVIKNRDLLSNQLESLCSLPFNIDKIKTITFFDNKKHVWMDPSIELLQWSEIKRKLFLKQVKYYNYRNLDTLFKSCLIKTFNKNYKSGIVKWVWQEHKTVMKYRSIIIFMFRDRIIQWIFLIAIHPICEYQADIHSYSFRPNRCALSAVGKVFKRCIVAQTLWNNCVIPIPCSEKFYLNTLKKNRYKQYNKLRTLPGKRLKKTCIDYKINCFFLKRIKGIVRKQNLSRYLYIWNFELENCFINIKHVCILEFIPICTKYLFLLNQWLSFDSFFWGVKSKLKKNVVFPTKGIFQGSILSFVFCNLVLDGVANLIKQEFINFNNNTIIYKLFGEQKYQKFDINYVRYTDKFILFGSHVREFFEACRSKIKYFLSYRGFLIKPKTDKIFQFKPGCQFNYLGYCFVFPSWFNKNKSNRGFFTKQRVFVQNRVISRGFQWRVRAFVCIDFLSYTIFKLRVRSLFKKGYFCYSVDNFIKKLNILIENFASYYCYSEQIRIQLNKLDFYIFNWFWKWLKKKYKSKSKLNLFLFKQFKTSTNIICGNFLILKRLTRVFMKSNLSLIDFVLSDKIVNSNIYILRKHSIF